MRYLNYLAYLAIPLAFLVHYRSGTASLGSPRRPSSLPAIGVIPLARLMGVATEHLAERAGPTWGGLLNATFGNAAELIIGIIAMPKGLNDVVQASLTGSILGNLLLVAGAAMVAGGWNREKQTFSRARRRGERRAAGRRRGGDALAGDFSFHLHVCTTPHLREHEHARVDRHERRSCCWSTAGVAVHAADALAHLFADAGHGAGRPGRVGGVHGGPWTVKKSVFVLLLASAGVARRGGIAGRLRRGDGRSSWAGTTSSSA